MAIDPQERFGFGQNWSEFISQHFSEERIAGAQERLLGTLRLESLKGKTMLDIGCGSGLHSLAAFKAGAERVVSFDYDPNSVATAKRLHEYAGSPTNWTITQGSVLDADFMRTFEPADIVYSWGVLHHTGYMWHAIQNARIPLKDDGVFFIALYSYTAYKDGSLTGLPTPEEWLHIKQAYNRSSAFGKRKMDIRLACNAMGKMNIRRYAASLYELYKMAFSRQERITRGMSFWTDIRDWLGGWPMEYVKEDEFFRFCRNRLGLEYLDMHTGEGNSEFLLRPEGASNYWDDVLAERTVTPLPEPWSHMGGHTWSVPVPDLVQIADTTSERTRSTVRLFEDGMPLRYPHASAFALQQLGSGRYRHEGESILFSTSDNSNPYINGKRYTMVI